MTGAVTGVAVLVAAALLVAVLYLLAKQRAPRPERRPDGTTDEVVSGLMGELRKWQAEAAHWKATAERLQRELDQR